MRGARDAEFGGEDLESGGDDLESGDDDLDTTFALGERPTAHLLPVRLFRVRWNHE
ncbi:hypothetical protein GCM10027444_31400 [Actinopolyspora lacussalsi]